MSCPWKVVAVPRLGSISLNHWPLKNTPTRPCLLAPNLPCVRRPHSLHVVIHNVTNLSWGATSRPNFLDRQHVLCLRSWCFSASCLRCVLYHDRATKFFRARRNFPFSSGLASSNCRRYSWRLFFTSSFRSSKVCCISFLDSMADSRKLYCLSDYKFFFACKFVKVI